MTILNTTFIVADHLMELFLAWARQAYMPALRDAGIFTAPTMAKVLAKVEPGATSIAIQARCHALEEATRWQRAWMAIRSEEHTSELQSPY